MTRFSFKTTAERNTNLADIVSLAKNAGFDVTADENENRIILKGEKDIDGTNVYFVVTVWRPNIRISAKGHGLSRSGYTVHLKNPAAVRDFILASAC